MTFATLLGKDARLLARHRVLLVALIVYPLLLAGVLHAAFSAPPEKLAIAVFDQDGGSEPVRLGDLNVTSALLVTRAREVADVQEVTSRAAGERLLREGTVDGVVILPKGFTRNLTEQGRGATLTLVTDGADPVRAGIASSSVNGFAQSFAREIVERKVNEVLRQLQLAVDGGTVRIVFFDVPVQGLRETVRELEDVRGTLPRNSTEYRKVQEAIDYLTFAEGALGTADNVLRTSALPLAVQSESFARTAPKLSEAALPGALALSVFWTGALAAAALFASEVEAGALARLQATPTSALARAGSKIVVALGLVVLQGLLVMATAAVFWNETPANAALAVPALALAGAAAAGAGALAAGLGQGRAGAALLVVLAVLPMTLVSGLFFPVDFMPQWVQAIAGVLPLTHAVDAFRDVIVRGVPLGATLPALGALAASAVVTAGGAALLLRERV